MRSAAQFSDLTRRRKAYGPRRMGHRSRVVEHGGMRWERGEVLREARSSMDVGFTLGK